MPASQVSSDHCVSSGKQILLAELVTLRGLDLSAATVSVVSAVPGNDVLCLSQQSPCKYDQLESILTTVDNNGLCKICLRNVSSLPAK